MLQNSKVRAFTVVELLRENQLGEGVKLPPPRLGLKSCTNEHDKNITFSLYPLSKTRNVVFIVRKTNMLTEYKRRSCFSN